MVKVTVRVLIIVLVLGFSAFMPRTTRAQNPLQPTQIAVGAPGQTNLGGPITVQAVLADSQGHPIPKEVIYFTTQATFLGRKGDVVLAQAVTNANGQAVAEFVDDTSGPLVLTGEFRGDPQYASSNATIQIGVTGGGQVYVDHIGVDLPGFNVPPVSAPKAALGSPQGGIAGFVQNLWPMMNGWPVAAVLLLVWSMYFFAVTFVFRVSALGDEPGDAAPAADPGRSA